ncbi:MAG: AMP-binding protein [Clostridiales Family XIII bacterium]|jgi:long-chain acyl-CoA synthetase|nr:AMP-binding protein [Clostridiales Family XIII bacterium]
MATYKTVRDMLTQVAEKYSDRPAFLQKRIKGGPYEAITYRQFMSDVSALGAKLRDLGLTGGKIAVIGGNCYQWTVAYQAVINGVGIVVPIDRQLKKAEIFNLLDRAGCMAVFYTEGFEEIFADSGIRFKFRMSQYTEAAKLPPDDTWAGLVDAGHKLPLERLIDYVNVEIDPEAPAVLMFTSGTTSIPKGVSLCHRNIAANVRDIDGVMRLGCEDRNLSILPNHHCFESILGTMYMLSKGASIAYGEGLKYILKNLAESGSTTLLAVPLLVESILRRVLRNVEKAGQTGILQRRLRLNKLFRTVGFDFSKQLFRFARKELGGLRMIFTGAAPIDPQICADFEKLGIRVLQGYGLTEATALVSGTPIDLPPDQRSVGKPIGKTTIRIDHPDSQGIGEVMFKGPNVMLGYYNMPDETAEIIEDGWLHTGDLGHLDQHGCLYITGRKKNVIVAKSGKNIYPEELEVIFGRNRYIDEIMIYGEEDGHNGPVVCAQIRPDYETIAADFGELDEGKVSELLQSNIDVINQQLQNYKRVRKFILRKEEFVKTTTKKLKRAANV